MTIIPEEALEQTESASEKEKPVLSAMERYTLTNVEASVAERLKDIDLSPTAPNVMRAASILRSISEKLYGADYVVGSKGMFYEGYILTFDGGVQYPSLLCYKANTIDYVNNQLDVSYAGRRYDEISEAAATAQLVYFSKSRLTASTIAKMMLCNNALTTEYDDVARTELVETAKELYPAIALRAMSYRSTTFRPPRDDKEFFNRVTDLSLAMLEDREQIYDFNRAVGYLYENGDERLLTQIAYYMGKELASETPSAAILTYLTDEFCRLLHNNGGVVTDTCGSDLKPSLVIGLSWSGADRLSVDNALVSFVDLDERKALAEKLGFTEIAQAGVNDTLDPKKVLEVCMPGMFMTTLGNTIKNEYLFTTAPSAKYPSDFMFDYLQLSARFRRSPDLVERTYIPEFNPFKAGFITPEVIEKMKLKEAEYLERRNNTILQSDLTEQETDLMHKLGETLTADTVPEADKQIGKALHVISHGKEIRSTPYRLVRTSSGVTGVMVEVNGTYVGIALDGEESVSDPKELLHKAGLPKAAEQYLREGD